MTRQEFIASVLYSLATSDISEVTEMTLKEAYDLVNDRANEVDFDDDLKNATLAIIDTPVSDKLPDEYWEDAPKWAEWVAMDESGKWHWYEEKPYKNNFVWLWDFGKCCILQAPPVPDWTKSLTKRPKQ
ncbi:MAG TPA: hypothetical protein VKP88_08090 [Candidatus Paceibacterota bacterium]|nr:hypothetical protein [Candidatus Paceibacterota bacterium]